MLWIGTDQLASAAGISDRGARKMLARAKGGAKWKGHSLDVRAARGPGGAAGSCYEVCVASLPDDVRARIALPIQAELPLIVLSEGDKSFRRSLVLPIIAAGPPGSSERADALRRVAASARYPSGKRRGKQIPERTLRAWVAAYESKGEAGVIRCRRVDRGKKRTLTWRALDRAMTRANLPETLQAEIASKIGRLVKGYWAGQPGSPGVCSAAWLQTLIKPDLREIALSAMPTLARDELDAICRMPPGFAYRYQKSRLAHKKRSDAGGWASGNVPRIQRDRSQLKPMEWVAADVRHADTMYRREDGTLATAKMVVFEDLATNRAFACVFLMKKGEMIKREHVLLSLMALFADPTWGIPQHLYFDNGGEFRTGLGTDELMAIAQTIRDTTGREIVFDGKQPPSPSGVLRSRPYNPQSKVIEGIFSDFTKIESMGLGYIGGNRMAKKVENQGRAKAPMPGGGAEVEAEVLKIVGLYNLKPQQRGHIKGKSPNEAFAAHVEAGWRSITFNPAEFELAFGKEERRQVKGGEFKCGGEVYSHDALLLEQSVRIRIPFLGTGDRIPVLTDKGEVLCVATIPHRYAMRDPEGAIEQRRRVGEQNRQVKAENEGAAKVHIGEKIDALIAAQPAAPIPRSAGVVSIRKLAEAIQETPAALRASKRSLQKRQFATAARLMESARAVA